MQTRTFDKAEDAQEWVQSFDAESRNFYFHVNPTRCAISKKASKLHIKSLSWLHVDVDPEPERDFDEERSRILKKLQRFRTPPSLIIDSGGGYQAFWRLSDPPLVDADLNPINTLESYNVQLARELGGDRCHNIDRIMRLPGTANVPNAHKRKLGRVVRQASVAFKDDVVYKLSEFQPAIKLQTESAGLDLPKIQIEGNIPSMDLDAFQTWCVKNDKEVSDHLFALINTGQDPYSEKYPSRSEALFAAVTMMVRADISNDVIHAVITGPCAIADSVRESGNPDAYALRQIARAHAATSAVASELLEMNERHAIIENYQGKCRILSKDPDDGSVTLAVQQDFNLRYRNRRVDVGRKKDGTPLTKSLADWWLDHPERTSYRTMEFNPAQDRPGVYNLWTGFKVPAIKGDLHARFLEHTIENVCGGKQDYYNYLMDWLAHLVQKPHIPGQTAIVLKGKRGTGKGAFVETIGKLFGRHYIAVTDSKHLVGSFNKHLVDKVLVFANEAFFAGDKKHESVLKSLITEDHRISEHKGYDAEITPNYMHLIMASNENWVIPAGLDERRFFVLQIGNRRRIDIDYFQKMSEEMSSGGLSNLLYELLNRNIKGFHPGRLPKTSFLAEQQLYSMSAEQQWLLGRIQDGSLLSNSDVWKREVIKDVVYAEYLRDMRDLGVGRKAQKSVFWKQIRDFLPIEKESFRKVEYTIEDDKGYDRKIKGSKRVITIPSLEKVRHHWDTQCGGPYEWPDAMTETEQCEIIEDDMPF